MSTEHRAYGWSRSGGDSSHGYLVAPIVKELDALFRGRRARILDLGCGNGHVSACIAAMGHEVVGFDASPDGIEIAKKAHPAVDFEVLSVYDDDLANKLGASFDAVVSLEVIEHLFYPKRLFEQARALLKPGGRLLLSTPYHGYLKNLAISLAGGWDAHFSPAWDGGHIKFFSPRTLGAMAREAGFTGVRFGGAGRVPYLWKSMLLFAER
jgi:2-polyprenyl-3-methyl-5-hydroxy-6-metoxy-1,4-benzoquinol methylase